MLPDTNTAWSIVAVIGVALVGGLITWWRRSQPDRAREKAGWDAILGKPPVLDRAGKEIEEAQPGLVHVTAENTERLTKVEEAFIELKDLVTAQDSLARRVDGHELRLDDHDTTLGLLIGEKYHKGSEATLKAIEKVQADSIDGEVEP